MSPTPITILSKYCAGISMACIMLTGHAQVSGTRWQLRVMDSNHRLKAEGTIRLTEEPETKSCMTGHWKIAVVETKTVSDQKFFPLTEPLAYDIENDNITIGRTRTCHDYAFLSGEIAP